ncbi:tyrosine-type recombinase/integrase [Mesorhizobium sp. L103C131B0]|uniref:tyrosine-type recombinase/integrase n=1 Tax=Mesorhizobium sp. L103C131B0 TaxID=1287089 RepID=UPI0003CFE378|nr:tyrosine-type recombinase/integrase [Mesorhizobium sp. L103C131B0]ESZ65711.1 integrase [Mesorhizobium sp. L103C131B0]
MAKRVRDAQLESRAARAKLKAQGKPYYKAIGPGLHVGYRKGKTGGVWVARAYLGDQDYLVQKVGIADDARDADGASILDFWQAQAAARAFAATVETPSTADAAPRTVGDVVTAYVANRDARDTRRRGRAVRSDASRRLHRYVLGQGKRGSSEAVPAEPLAGVAMASLTEDDLKAWRAGLPASLAETTKRRLSNDLKAALHSERKLMPAALLVGSGLKSDVDADDSADVARENQILADSQVVRLLVAARQVDDELGWDGDLYRLVLVLNATGARFSQISRMRVRDAQLKEGRLMVPSSRKGKGKSGSIAVPVEAAVIEALRPIVTGRAPDATLLERWQYRQPSGGIKWERAGRGPWQTSSDVAQAWKAIRAQAGMPAVIMYSMRHSSIVRGIRANLPIRLVAALHDTSVAMIERHYGRWIVDGLEDMARAAVVSLVPQDVDAKVVPLNATNTR